MNVLKKSILIILSLIMVLSFAGCSGKIIEEEETTDVVETTLSNVENTTQRKFFDYKKTTTPITQDVSNDIVSKYNLNEKEFILQYSDSDVTIALNAYEGYGYDKDGYEYNENFEKKGIHDFCQNPIGIGVEMCNGTCNIAIENLSGMQISIDQLLN